MRRGPIKPPGGIEVRGSYVVAAIVLAALAAVAFAWTYRYFRSRDVLALWGPEAAQLIQHEADEIWLEVLAPAEPAPAGARTIQIDRRTFVTTQSKNVAQAQGLLNARQALVENESFLWGKPRGDCQPRWEYALTFVAGETGRRATLAVDTQCSRARLLETGAEAALLPRIADALHGFVREQLSPSSDASPPGAQPKPPGAGQAH